MRRANMVLPLLVALLAVALVASRTGTAGETATEQAYFLVGFPTETTTFVLLLTDPATLEQARNILKEGRAEDYIFGGRIIVSAAAWNTPWSYHVDPSSVTFARAFVETCDAHPAYVEAHLDEVAGAFLPGGYWCPWSSRLLRELPPPEPPVTPGACPRCLFLPLALR